MAAVTGVCVRHLGRWASVQLPRALLAVGNEAHLSPNPSAASPPSLPAPEPLPRAGSGNHVRPGVAVIVGIFTTMLSITFLLLLYAKHCRRTMGRPYGGRPGGASFLANGRRNSGVDRSVVESLPVFRFGSLRGRKEGLECAVCLGRFGPEELLRLLPKCKHAFHVECVDTWLDAHSTCPICRHRVDPEDVLLAFQEYEPPAGPKPHPADAAEGPSSKGEGEAAVPPAAVATPSPASAFGFFRSGRISGRHSSAGERRSDSAVQVVVQRPASDAPTQRSSVDNALMLRAAAMASKATMGCFDGGCRKDQLLLTENPTHAGSAAQLRFGHRIVVTGEGDLESGGGGAVPRRWSDMRPQDLLLLRREMILASGARTSSCSSSAASCGGADGGAIGTRSVSEITGLSRFASGGDSGAAGEGRTAEQRVLRRWLSLATKRAGRWLSRRAEASGSGPGPNHKTLTTHPANFPTLPSCPHPS